MLSVQTNSDSLVGKFSAPMKRLANDTVTPFGQSKPPIYLCRARHESLPARWCPRARDGRVRGHLVNLLERSDYPVFGKSALAQSEARISKVRGMGS